MKIAFPVCLALSMMAVLHRYLSPAVVIRFLGKSSGLKGVLLSASAGILSMGLCLRFFVSAPENLEREGRPHLPPGNFHGESFHKTGAFSGADRLIGDTVFPRSSHSSVLEGALLSAAIVSLFCPDLPAAGGEGKKS